MFRVAALEAKRRHKALLEEPKPKSSWLSHCLKTGATFCHEALVAFAVVRAENASDHDRWDGTNGICVRFREEGNFDPSWVARKPARRCGWMAAVHRLQQFAQKHPDDFMVVESTKFAHCAVLISKDLNLLWEDLGRPQKDELKELFNKIGEKTFFLDRICCGAEWVNDPLEEAADRTISEIVARGTFLTPPTSSWSEVLRVWGNIRNELTMRRRSAPL